MAENVQVASLTAPITVKVPTAQLKKFQEQLEEIADTLEFIVAQMKDMTTETTRGFGKMSNRLKAHKRNMMGVTAEHKKINQEQNKTRNGAKRTAKAFGSWANALAKVRVALGLVTFAISNVVKLLAVPAGAFGAFTFLAGRINATTSEMIRLSEATGMGLNDMRAMTVEAKALGFTFEHVSSLVEELNNKMGGEEGGFIENNLREGLDAIGLSAENLQKRKPAEQLSKIMDAGAKILKAGDLAKAASAYDKIFGQEANRMLTGITQKMLRLGLTYDQLMARNRSISTVTEDAQKGALAFTDFFHDMTTAIDTISRNFFGTFGSKIAPFLKGLSPVFEGLSDDIMKVFGSDEVMSTLREGFIEGIDQLIILFNQLKKDPELVSKGLKLLINSLKSMFKIGKMLFDLFLESLPVIEQIVAFIASDAGMALIKWTGAILAATAAWKGLILLKAGIIALASVIKWKLIASLKLLLAPLALTLKTFLAIGAAFAVGWGIGKWLGEVTGATEALEKLINTMDLFGLKKEEQRVQELDDEHARLNALRKLNMRRLEMGKSTIAVTSAGRFHSEDGTGPDRHKPSVAPSTTVQTIHNHVVLPDAAAAKPFVDEFINPPIN